MLSDECAVIVVPLFPPWDSGFGRGKETDENQEVAGRRIPFGINQVRWETKLKSSAYQLTGSIVVHWNSVSCSKLSKSW